ncbi:MAG: ABC transporter ATP-binding protein [Deltaproteobacteria bacterium]|nr:ABC transporter ATP-binding protein [Deltaproteobacteria bacterium]MBW2049995.1 ABC transporter ATP-binding protein [Deltaproteobacteria bacterium]MBW2112346.1 ABC transporter ATP-binding protein [Deltaproteobacteria bacterium]MBW2354552.1 ABC transporter ATP-binding protein [Deltaproteobacteria bacterium]
MLRVREIDVYYGQLQALVQVSIDVDQGEVVSVIGSNGTGKSTTLKTISGILKPRRGTIEYKGQVISRRPPSEIVELGISHIPEGRQIFPTMTVLENLEMGAQFPRGREALKQTLELVFSYFPALNERLKQKAGTLSGGEQQMLAMGRGLMSRPALLMLDEPSLGLAPILVSTIFEIIRQIHEQGRSILLIEQNVYHALNLSNRGYVLENGRVVLSGVSKELLENPHIRKTYLGL